MRTYFGSLCLVVVPSSWNASVQMDAFGYGVTKKGNLCELHLPFHQLFFASAIFAVCSGWFPRKYSVLGRLRPTLRCILFCCIWMHRTYTWRIILELIIFMHFSVTSSLTPTLYQLWDVGNRSLVADISTPKNSPFVTDISVSPNEKSFCVAARVRQQLNFPPVVLPSFCINAWFLRSLGHLNELPCLLCILISSTSQTRRTRQWKVEVSCCMTASLLKELDLLSWNPSPHWTGNQAIEHSVLRPSAVGEAMSWSWSSANSVRLLLEAHTGLIRAFSLDSIVYKDPTTVLAGGSDGMMRVIDLRTVSCIRFVVWFFSRHRNHFVPLHCEYRAAAFNVRCFVAGNCKRIWSPSWRCCCGKNVQVQRGCCVFRCRQHATAMGLAYARKANTSVRVRRSPSRKMHIWLNTCNSLGTSSFVYSSYFPFGMNCVLLRLERGTRQYLRTTSLLMLLGNTLQLDRHCHGHTFMTWEGLPFVPFLTSSTSSLPCLHMLDGLPLTTYAPRCCPCTGEWSGKCTATASAKQFLPFWQRLHSAHLCWLERER